MGIPIPQKKIIKKNYSVLSSRTLSTTLQNTPETGKYGSTLMHTPYGDIKVLVGPDYKAPKAAESEQLKGTADYSKDKFNSDMENTADQGEILAEDYQDTDEAIKTAGKDGLLGAGGDTKYDNLMAVAPEENILNRYPLAPPKFTRATNPMTRNINKSINSPYGLNALYYQPYQGLPMNPSAVAGTPYNYPYSNIPFPAPMYFGY